MADDQYPADDHFTADNRFTADDQNPANDILRIAGRLTARLGSYGATAVALSGGVDSAVVAKAAWLALGSQCVAVTAISPSLSAADRGSAASVARHIGIRHVELPTDEFDRPEYRANAGDRCYYCKDTLYTVTAETLQTLQMNVIANGANLDDLGDHRPGMRAAAEHFVKSPLIEEGIDKATVRRLAHFWQLEVADKPASPCLASRIAYGVEVTSERVRRVELAEAFLQQQTGVSELRVRCEPQELARIEVPVDRIADVAADPLRDAIVRHFLSLGFRAVTIDLQGFRSGNLNSRLPLVTLGQHS